jgi:hypothetical protein
MKKHCHVIPQADEKYPYSVAYFGSRGSWCGASFHRTKDDARSRARRLNRRWRDEYNNAEAGRIADQGEDV